MADGVHGLIEVFRRNKDLEVAVVSAVYELACGDAFTCVGRLPNQMPNGHARPAGPGAAFFAR